MAVLERLEEVARSLEAIANRIRESVGPAESLAESRANTAIYSISEAIEEISMSLRKLKCIAEAKGAEGSVLAICTTWRVFEQDGGLVAVRVKPETVISFREGKLVFHRGNVRMEVEGRRVKLCKLHYCKEVDPTNRKQVIEELPQIFYLLRGVTNNVRKTLDSTNVCARREAPACTRI
ncbi:MAG TPA: hypothetical protein EYH50_02600 [Pyrodictium delaneyi]|uniref:Uncharacterized protein n=1 Tax=Pyrodictium delaneyi TaxID=1273541 RepID=A0A832ZTC3_9CREN|nr:hypothetical protein [Pyrodictium delaneyi]